MLPRKLIEEWFGGLCATGLHVLVALTNGLNGLLMEGVRAMRGHREGRITLRSHHITPLSLPSIDEQTIRSTRERLHMSRSAFAQPNSPFRCLDMWTRPFSGESCSGPLQDKPDERQGSRPLRGSRDESTPVRQSRSASRRHVQ